jgi:hypothetical protein
MRSINSFYCGSQLSVIPSLTEDYTEPLHIITAYYYNTHLHIICLYGSLTLPLLHAVYRVKF